VSDCEEDGAIGEDAGRSTKASRNGERIEQVSSVQSMPFCYVYPMRSRCSDSHTVPFGVLPRGCEESRGARLAGFSDLHESMGAQ
jgi:hypothetical protein